jgi:hypothetical protein
MYCRRFTGVGLALAVLIMASVAIGASPGDVVINELYMNTEDYFDGSEYFELYNTTGSPIDVGGWVLSSVEYDEICGEHNHQFPLGTTIAAYGYLIIVRDVTNADSAGFSNSDRFEFLPDLEMYDDSQSYEYDDPRVPNTRVQNPDDFDDQIRLYPGTSDYAYRCTGAGRYEVMYLYGDSLLTTLIDAVEYRDMACGVDMCTANGTNDAYPAYPSTGFSLGRDESGSDTDDSSADLSVQVATPGAQNIANVPPDIWTLRYSPCVPTTSDQVTISCYIADDHGIQWARCYYAVATDPPDFTYGAFDSMTMTDPDNDSLFTCVLPAQAVDPSYLKFYVKASDNLGMVAAYPEDAPAYTYNYSVGTTLISDIQTVDIGSDSSYYLLQAVNVSGVVTAERGIYNDYTFVVQDGSGQWSGIYVYDGSASVAVARGDSVTLSGWVNEYFARTEIDLFSGCVTNHGPGTIPDPTVVSTTSISTASLIAERYEGVYVATQSVTVTNDSLGYGEWEINDGSGPCRVDDYAYYVYTPKNGDQLEEVRGILDYSYDDFKIQPRGDEDILGPPAISNVRYTPHAPTASDQITMSATVTCADPIVSVKTYFSTNDGASWDSTSMSASDSVYTGTIGPLPDDSSVEYYVMAWANTGATARRPSAGSYSFYVGRVSIYDVQFTAGGDSSAYAGKPVNISGIVTAGTGTYSDYFFFIEEEYGGGSAEYRGVKVYTGGPSVTVARGDSVTVSGDVWEYFLETEVSMPFAEAITIHSSGHEHPPAYVTTPGSVNTSEQWEGVLVKVENATVITPDNGFGEWTVYGGGVPSDTCVIGDIVTYSYVPSLSDVVIVTGISMFAYGEYTLQPRDDDDICHPGMAGVDDAITPVRLALSIFPNPVMSAGEIRLAIPSNDRVSVKIYDVKGKYVETLMDKAVQAGEHHVTWEGRNSDGRRVTPGVYFVRVETTRGSLTQKMVLSR